MEKETLKNIKLPPKPAFDPFRIKLTPEMMLPATKEEREQLIMMRESTTYWKDAMRRLRTNKVAMISLAIIVVIFLFAFVGPLLMPYSYDQQIRGHERLEPVINGGMIDVNGGWMGAGSAHMPLACCQAAGRD